jgi:hypothetical protein
LDRLDFLGVRLLFLDSRDFRLSAEPDWRTKGRSGHLDDCGDYSSVSPSDAAMARELKWESNKPAAGNAGLASWLTVTRHCPGVPEPERSIRMPYHASGWFDRLREADYDAATQEATTTGALSGHGQGAPRISRIATDIRGRLRRVLSVPIRVIRGQNQSGSNQALEPMETAEPFTSGMDDGRHHSHPAPVWGMGDANGCSIAVRQSTPREGGCA